jgi:hypothetical protein
VVAVDRCGIEAHGRHVPIGECGIDVGRARVLWFRFDELAPSDLELATRPERERAGAQSAEAHARAVEGSESLRTDLVGRESA